MQITLNKKAKQRILSGHPWVFKSDLQTEEQRAGIVEVHGPQKEFLGKALYSPHSEIRLRMVSLRQEKIDTAFWRKRIEEASAFRETLSIPSNAYRVVFGESDGIPSFILDRYDTAYVFQILSAGLEMIRSDLLKIVQDLFHPNLLVERNDVSVRNLEQLPLTSQIAEGNEGPRLKIKEGELLFEVDLLEGQKTGAFLDQRDNRLKAARFAKGKNRILDVFAYQGWFACHLSQTAQEVIAIEQNKNACREIERNAALNQITSLSTFEANAFDLLREMDQRKEKFDLINLDPPAFVKSRSQLRQALKGYKEINLRAMKLLKKGGILISSSCSHHLSEERFLDVLREASYDAKCQVQIIDKGGQAPDHPILLTFPESRYLKCFFLRILKE